MNVKTAALLFFALLTILFFSCKDTSTNPTEKVRAKAFLESEIVNNAWGYLHQGWVVDTAGNIVSYDIAKSGAHWAGNPSGYYTEEELQVKFSHCDTLRGTVPADTVLWLRALAAASVGGAYSDTVQVGADMGGWIYSCYVFVADSSKYRQVVLQVNGDYRYYNTSPSAVQLSGWISQRHP